MLVLSRKVGEEVVIAGDIRVSVLSIHGSQVRLGFTAPGDVPIYRGELGSTGHRPERIACPARQRSEEEVADPVI